jgi:hypothetical protein
MKKVFEWMKARGGVLAGLTALFILALSWLKIFSLENLSPDAKVQAALMVLLIIITGFYAFQTHRLVKEQRRALEEERKKRYAEFGMQRMQKFLRPLLQHAEGLKDSVSQIAEASKRPLEINYESALGIFQARLNETKEFFIEYLFMTDPILRYGYLKIAKMTMPKSIERQSEKKITQWKEKIDEYIGELETVVNNKISGICQNIRKTYGFFSRDTENLESSDDLTVLSDRPPRRI